MCSSDLALYRHPAVLAAAVVAKPDPKWGERVEAAVVLAEGASATAEALVEWCRDKLAGFKRPRAITFLEPGEMPRNTTGKILHRVLRDMLAARRR